MKYKMDIPPALHNWLMPRPVGECNFLYGARFGAEIQSAMWLLYNYRLRGSCKPIEALGRTPRKQRKRFQTPTQLMSETKEAPSNMSIEPIPGIITNANREDEIFVRINFSITFPQSILPMSVHGKNVP